MESSKSNRFGNLPKCSTACNTYRIQVLKRDIGFVNAVLEGYDNLARVKTEHIDKGVLQITIPQDMDELYHSIIRGLNEKGAGIKTL